MVFFYTDYYFLYCLLKWLLYAEDINNSKSQYRIGGVMVSVIATSAVDCGFEPRSGQTKDSNWHLCFSAKHAALSRKNTDRLARNRDNLSKLGDMTIYGLLFQ